jgi:hypothetical protein
MSIHVEDASYSDDGMYRWWFSRRWALGPTVCWVGLHPGTGDADGTPRPTLARMTAWSRRWGFGALIVVNLFAYRTTDPKLLKRASRAGIDVVGRRTDASIQAAIVEAERTVAAWGSHGRFRGRGREVSATIPYATCLGTTRTGEPRHPLFVRNDAELLPYLSTSSTLVDDPRVAGLPSQLVDSAGQPTTDLDQAVEIVFIDEHGAHRRAL